MVTIMSSELPDACAVTAAVNVAVPEMSAPMVMVGTMPQLKLTDALPETLTVPVTALPEPGLRENAACNFKLYCAEIPMSQTKNIVAVVPRSRRAGQDVIGNVIQNGGVDSDKYQASWPGRALWRNNYRACQSGVGYKHLAPRIILCRHHWSHQCYAEERETGYSDVIQDVRV